MAVFRKAVSLLLRVGISFAIIFLLFRGIDRSSLFQIIKGSDKLLLFISFLVAFSGYALSLVRWRMLLLAADIRIPLRRLIISFSAGQFFNLFLPSTIGGDFMRGADLSFYTKKPKKIIATLFLDRLSGCIGLAVLAICAMFLGWGLLRDKSVAASLAIILGLLAAGLFILFNKFLYNKINGLLKSPKAGRLRDLITGLHEEVHTFRYKKAVAAKNILVSLCIQIAAPLSFYITSLALGVKISPLYFFIFIPIIGAITLVPISIGGLGLRDATTIFFFAKAGVGKDMAFAMSLLSFSYVFIIGALGGLIYVLAIHNRRM